LPSPQFAAGDDALSPEERINIAVYEKVNRSVVNIRTETMRNGAFFFLRWKFPAREPARDRCSMSRDTFSRIST
jgi:hypothetical protein